MSDGTVQLLELLPPNSGSEFASARLQPRARATPGLRGGGVPTDRAGGVPGGARERVLFLKRCRAPKDLGTLRSAAPHFEHNGWLGRDGALPEGAAAFVELEDLDVGRTVRFVGREMRVVGCEPSSRTFLGESLGIELAADEQLF